MESIFQINTRYNCLIIPSNIEVSYDESSTEVIINNSSLSFNEILVENKVKDNNTCNKLVKEGKDFNIIYIGNEPNTIFKNLFNNFPFENKDKNILFKTVKYGIKEIDVNKNKMFDILNSKKESSNLNEFTYKPYEYKNNEDFLISFQFHKDLITIISFELASQNEDLKLNFSFIHLKQNQSTLLPLFTSNYSNNNSIPFLLHKVDSLLSYQNKLSQKISSLPFISSETLQNISSYKNDCINYYSSIIDNFEQLKNNLCSDTKVSNGQNLVEQFDNFIKSQHEIVNSIIKNEKNNIYANELNAYKTLIDFYVLKETSEMEKANENGEANYGSYYENLKDLIYRYIDSNEEISNFLNKFKLKLESSKLKEEYNGLHKIINNSDKEEISKLRKQINTLVNTIKTQKNLIEKIRNENNQIKAKLKEKHQINPENKPEEKKQEIKQEVKTEVHKEIKKAIVFYVQENNTFSFIGQEKEDLGKTLLPKFRKSNLIVNDLYKEYLDICNSYVKYRESIIKKREIEITKNSKIKDSQNNKVNKKNKENEQKTESIKSKSKEKNVRQHFNESDNHLSLKIKELESSISKLKEENQIKTSRIEKLESIKDSVIYENTILQEKIKKLQLMKNSPTKINLYDGSPDKIQDTFSVMDTQRKQKKQKGMNNTSMSSINPESLILLNKIKQDNKLISEQLEFFNQQNLQLQSDLIQLKQQNKLNNPTTPTHVSDFVNSSSHQNLNGKTCSQKKKNIGKKLQK